MLLLLRPFVGLELIFILKSNSSLNASTLGIFGAFISAKERRRMVKEMSFKVQCKKLPIGCSFFGKGGGIDLEEF